MKSVKFNTEKESSNHDLVSSPSSPSAKRKASKRMSAANSNRNSSPKGKMKSDAKDNRRASKRRASNITRIVTGFRGGIVPEHRGHMPRVGHTGVLFDRDFYVFGGYNAKGAYNNQVYRHEKRSLQWEEVRGFGMPPPGRANHSATLCGTKMIIYGGHKQLEVLDDMHSFDLTTKRWEKIFFEKSQSPGPTFLHAAVYVPPIHHLVIMGGFHQREHNVYLGHAFDIKNKVWSGIPCPSRVNPQQIQLPQLAFHEPNTSIVVLGLINMDITTCNPSRSIASINVDSPLDGAATQSVPRVHMVNIHSWVWTEILTCSSPESPLPFRIEAVWDAFMTRLVQMGGYYDEVQSQWYFPVSFYDFRGLIIHPKNKSRSQYGFLKLQLDDMVWSLVPTDFPRKIMKELEDKNTELLFQREGMSSAERDGRGSAHRSMGSDRGREANGVLSESLGLSFGSYTEMKNNTKPKGRNPIIQTSEDGVREQRKRIFLFTVDGEPQYQHKYVFGAYRETSQGALLTDNNNNTANVAFGSGNATGKNSSTAKAPKPKPIQYIIMHGGLFPETDYSMLMFTPVVTRLDAHTSRKLSNAESTTTLENSLVKYTEEDDENSSMLHSQSDNIGMSTDSISVIPTNPYTANMDDGKDEPAAKSSLPGIPGINGNTKKIAMQYTAANSVQKMQHLLPYPNIPVIILEDEKDINNWGEDHYKDSREWLAEKLKDVAAEDRMIKKAKKRQPSASGAPGAQSSSPSAETQTKKRKGSKARKSKAAKSSAKNKKGSTVRSAGNVSIMATDDDEDSLDSFALSNQKTGEANENDKVPKEDFFKRKNLEVYNLNEMIDFEKNETANTEYDRAYSLLNNRKEIVPAGLERLWMKVKRHAEKQRLPSTIFKQRGSVGDGGNVAELGIAMAFVIMRNAIDNLKQDGSFEMRRARAHYRWRFLRTLVRTGEAAFILYRVSQDEAKMQALTVSSIPGLVMAPELSTVSSKGPNKVPTRQVPFVVQEQPRHQTRYTEVTKSGMVVYHNLSRKM